MKLQPGRLLHTDFQTGIIKNCCKLAPMETLIYITSGYEILCAHNTAQKMKFSIKDLFSKCDQISSFFY